MNLEERVESLKALHQTLEQRIQSESKRPHPDEAQLHELKKQKLKIKDELAGISPS